MSDEFFVCDGHTRQGGYESCCACYNDDPNDDRECSEATESE